MKKLSSLIFLFSIAALSVSAKQRTASIYREKFEEWADKPIVHPVPPEYKNEPAIVLLNDISYDLRVESKSVNKYLTIHRIVKVLDDKGIEEFNTADLPVHPGTRVPSIRARTILPNGKVKEIAQDMIKVTKNPHGWWSVIIAMEGVEKDAEIELLIKEIVTEDFFGTEYFQFPIPVLTTHFSMSYPKEIVLEEKGYNGFPDAKDTILHNRRRMSVSLYDIPKLKPEPNSFYDIRLMRMEYRLNHFDYINENNKERRYTWSDLGRRIYDVYSKITDKERAAVNVYLSELGVKQNGDELENIKKIEEGIKTGIVQYGFVDYEERKIVLATNQMRSVSLYDVAYDQTKDVLDSIIRKRAATPSGITKLFVACFVQAGVNFELGLAGNKYQSYFDPKFENWDNMIYHVFYFSDYKKFLSPNSAYLRYPVVPDEMANNKGVFCTIPPNGFPTGQLSEIRTITPLSVNESQSNIAAAVSFTTDMDAQIDISYSYTGYSSVDLRDELALEPKNKEKDLVKRIVTIADRPESILKYTISNEGFNNYWTNKPLEITATVNTSNLTEIADKNYLFKVGKIIGPHHQLYNDDERQLPVDLEYPYSQNRTITLNLPVGYKVLNPEAVRMHADYVNKDVQPVISFSSDYTIIPDKKNGDKMVITINEFYKQLHFSPEGYEHYRAVINKAADFNKATLIIVPKKGPVKHEHALSKR